MHVFTFLLCSVDGVVPRQYCLYCLCPDLWQVFRETATPETLIYGVMWGHSHLRVKTLNFKITSHKPASAEVDFPHFPNFSFLQPRPPRLNTIIHIEIIWHLERMWVAQKSQQLEEQHSSEFYGFSYCLLCIHQTEWRRSLRSRTTNRHRKRKKKEKEAIRNTYFLQSVV